MNINAGDFLGTASTQAQAAARNAESVRNHEYQNVPVTLAETALSLTAALAEVILAQHLIESRQVSMDDRDSDIVLGSIMADIRGATDSWFPHRTGITR